MNSRQHGYHKGLGPVNQTKNAYNQSFVHSSNRILDHQSQHQRIPPLNLSSGLTNQCMMYSNSNSTQVLPISQTQSQCYSTSALSATISNPATLNFSHAQQYSHQPIYNPIYQSLPPPCQASYQTLSPVMTNLAIPVDNSSGNFVGNPLVRNTIRQLPCPMNDCCRQSLNLSYNNQYSNSQPTKIFTTNVSNQTDFSPFDRFEQIDRSPPASTATANSSLSVGNNDRWNPTNDDCVTNPSRVATKQTTKLVETSPSSSNDSSSKTSNQRAFNDGRLKSYLAHLVLSSNIPFAYAIILVAFLITVITATSIITILTVVLTLTGYTAYPLTENSFNISLAIGVVCASFALALVTASLIVWRRHCQAAYYYLDDPQTGSRGTNSPQLSETYDDSEYGSVAVNEWAKHVQKLHADGDIGFSKEFEQIQQAKNSNLTCEHSQMPENKQKNRYINIVAYDHTRVTLRTLPGQKKPGADYINANYIDVSRFNELN